MAFGGATQDTGGQGEHGAGQRSRGLGLRARSWLLATWLLAGFLFTSGAAGICLLLHSIKTIDPHKCPGSSTHCRLSPSLEPPAPSTQPLSPQLLSPRLDGRSLAPLGLGPGPALPEPFRGSRNAALGTTAALLLPGSLLLSATGTPGTQGPQPGMGLASRALKWKAKSREAPPLPPNSTHSTGIDKV